MNPGLKYALGRLGLFIAVAVPAVLLLPRGMNVLLKLMIALVISAVLAWFLLRRWREEVAARMSASAQRKIADRQRLRAALAGEDEPNGASTLDDSDAPRRPDADRPDADGRSDAAGPDGDRPSV